METRVKTSRVGEIELFRFIFCIIIMCCHSSHYLIPDVSLFLGGSFGVEFFFLVSGYLMMVSINKRQNEPTVNLGWETLAFLKKKTQSFYPELCISFVIAFVFQCAAKKLTLIDIAKLFSQSFFELILVSRTGIGANSINGVVWYIQSMLLCMAILYPMIRRFPDMMKHIVMPLTGLFLIGHLVHVYGNLREPHKWLNFTYKGNLRAMAELCLGASLIPPAVAYLKKLRFRTGGKLLLTFVKWCCWLSVIAYSYIVTSKCKQDAFMLVLLGVAVTLAFSGQCLDVKLYQNKLVLFLGKFSLPLYLNHVYYSHYLNKFLPSGLRFRYQFLIYVICSVLTALVVMALANCIRKLLPNVKKNLKTLLLYD